MNVMSHECRSAYPTSILMVTVLATLLASAPPAHGQNQSLTAAELDARVGIDQELGAVLPSDLELVDSRGESLRMGELLGERPVVLALVYYECPMLCRLVMDGMFTALRPLDLELGRDFDIVTVSIDPGETPEMAAAKRAEYLEEYDGDAEAAARGLHTLTADQETIERLAQTVGFRYVYDPVADQYAHGAAIMVVTPEGEVSRYFYGVEYSSRDLRLGLVEAADGGIGSVADQVLLLCYQYDPTTGKYGFMVWTAIRIGGALTVLAILGFVTVALLRERRDRGGRSEAVAASTGGTHAD